MPASDRDLRNEFERAQAELKTGRAEFALAAQKIADTERREREARTQLEMGGGAVRGRFILKHREAGWVCALGALVAAFFVGQAIQVSNGAGAHDAFLYLFLAMLSLFISVGFGSAGQHAGPRVSAFIVALAGAAVLYQLWKLGSVPPAMYLQNTNFFDFMPKLILFGALAVAALAPRSWLGWLAVPAALAAFWALGIWLFEKSPNPHIDVFTETNEAIRGLLSGQNPWSMKYENIYHHTLWYGPGAADNDWIYVGFPYPPFSLIISSIGYAFHDIRWANLGSLVVAAISFWLGRGRFGVAAAMVLLTTPRVFFMLEQAWTDVYIIGLLGLVLWSAAKFPKATPVLLALMLVTKQYMIFLAPFVPFLFEPTWNRRQILRFLIITAVVGLAVNLPFIAMGPKVLFSALTYSQHPFRTEALSFLAATAVNGQPIWPLWIAVPLLVPVYVLMWWRGPRGPAGFAIGTALVICVFFSFGKHAFCNHHFLVLGCACAAFATAVKREDDGPPRPRNSGARRWWPWGKTGEATPAIAPRG